MALKDVKKMCSKFCNGNSSNIVGYTPPTLHKGVRWFVDFTSLDLVHFLRKGKGFAYARKRPVTAIGFNGFLMAALKLFLI